MTALESRLERINALLKPLQALVDISKMWSGDELLDALDLVGRLLDGHLTAGLPEAARA
ncbi:MAG: hypothetical protein AAF219_02425 [Myxococcota bacterium]